MMNTLAGMTLAGSAVLVLWLAASKILKNRLPARWHYRILKLSLLFFLVPVGRILPLAGQALSALKPVPAALPVSAPAQMVPVIPITVLPRTPVTAPAAPLPVPAPVPESFALSAGTLRALAVVWMIGAAGMLAYKICVYLLLRRRVFRQNRPVSSQEARLVFWSCKRQLGVRGPVALWENPAARSPFAAGLLRPTVVIPSVKLEREELRYLFFHELTHIRCGDLWVRFFAMLAQVVHWYNPLAYVLSRSIQAVSEQSCDERVACPLSRKERYVYGNVILKLAAGAAAGSGDWAASLSTRESMERRLIRVLRSEKMRGGKRLAALLLALAILTCGGGAALAARNPLPVSKEEKKPAHTVTTLPREEGAKSGGSAVKSGESAAKPVETDSAVTLKEDETKQLEDPKPDKPVTTNGTPSEAFLKKLREYFGVPADTPVLFGDHALIVSRGGILLPDEDFDSYTCVSGGSDSLSPVIYKEFHTKNSGFDPRVNAHVNVCLSEYDVGRPEALEACNQFISSTLYNLINGEYPKNSRGESFGHDGFSDYVGYYPDLHAAHGTKGELGYIYNPDEAALPHNLPKDECPHSFLVPLYDKEHKEIGKFEMSCGGHMMEDVISKGLTAEEAKAALASGEISNSAPTYDDPSANTLEMIRAEAASKWTLADITGSTPVLFGDKDLILRHGGTLLPDNDLGSYTCVDNVIYKTFLDKNGDRRQEYPVGNKDLLSFPNQLKELTADGDYPKNSKGESYGSQSLQWYVGYAPDLQYVAEYLPERRPAGYTRAADYRIPDHTAEECKKEYPIPLYNPEGEVIGQYLLSCGSLHIDTTGMNVEDVKAALAAGASTTEEARAAAAGAAQKRVPNQEPPANYYTVYWDAAGNWHQQEEVRGDLELIRSRGGTLLPDGDGISYLVYTGDSQHVYRRYRDRDGVLRREDRVGNKEALSEEARALLNTLVKGEYPKNAGGETYGYECLADYVGYAPDLAVWVEGPEQGYWRQKELEDQADALHFACKCPGEFRIPLYASDGKTVKTHVTYICPYSVHLE